MPSCSIPRSLGSALARLARHDGDFQDLKAWRSWTVRLAKTLSLTRSVVVVPMTVVDVEYFRETVGVLRQHRKVLHFTLVASRDTLRERLMTRGKHHRWALLRIERCVVALQQPSFAAHIETDRFGIDEVADRGSTAVQDLLPY
jgi:hypothetical protein